MKKTLLILSIFVVTFSSAFAADLNPFAYGLRSSVNASNPMQLDIQFSINAPATSVKVVVYDIATKTDVYTYSCTAYNEKHDYALSLDLSNIPGQYRGGVDNLGWRVDVKGAAVGKDLDFVSNSVKLYSPTSIDVDNNPQNENFGTVFVVEGMPNAKDNATYANYLSYADGAGLYILNADGSARPMPNRPNGRYGYNGGRVQQTRQYFNGNKSGGYSPYRVRVSEDGRIFISSMTPDGEVLWEADPLVFSRPDAADWEARAVAGWSHVMSAKNANTVLGTAKRNCTHTYCGIYNLYEGNAETGLFIAGPNLGFDVKGSGEDLKLLMLAGCKQAIVSPTPDHFYCDEYDLGEAKMWNTPPSRRIFKGNVVNYAGVQVQYDKDGNVWMCQHRSGTDAATLMKFNGAATNAVLYDENPKKPYHRCGAIRFNQDFTKVAIASIGDGSGGAVTIYPVEDGMPIWAQGVEVKIQSTTHVSHMDYAWDYADNLYVVADAASGSAGRCVAVYATKRSADKVVSTPAASRYAFTVSCQAGEYYDVQVNTQDVTYGTVGGGGDNIASCETTTVFAQSKDGYRFVCWKEGSTTVSTNNPYTFVVTKDITLTAHFEEGDYNVTWWNLFEEGEDIYEDNDDRNYRVYELFRPLYNTLQKTNRWQQKFETSDALNSGDKNVLGFCYSDGTVEMLSGDYPMKWLGDYLAYVAKEQGVVNAQNWGWTTWGIHLYGFVNRTKYARNQQGIIYTGSEGLVGMEGLNGFPDYTGEFGLPTKWRPWWTSIECGLPNEMKYSSKMPTQFTKEPATTGYKAEAGETSQVIKGTPSWYVWNYEADKLLAWRDGGTTITDKIVHHVDRNDMKLYATYVDKTLQENDPDPTGEYEAKNSDVLSLLANENHGTTDHNITIDRKFVAGMYNTVCFPFDLHRSLFPTKLKDAEVLTFDGVTVTGNEYGEPVAVLNFITLEEYWQKWNEEHPNNQVDLEDPYMEAGVPYLIKPNTDISDDYLTYSGLKYWNFFNGEREPYSIHHNGVTFQGVLNPTILPEDACILVADSRLAKVEGTGEDRKIKGYRGYFVIDNIVISQMAEEGNVYFSFNKPVTTSVPLAPEAEQPKKTKVRKVMYNGQIYILRGDEVYTITGHRVK